VTGDRNTTAPPISDVLPIALRAYGRPEAQKSFGWDFQNRGPSKWFLIFDTETTTDPSQCLRIGGYQLRYGEVLRERGLFFNPEALSRTDIRIVRDYARAKRVKILTLREFVDRIFVRVAYHWQATTIGFNLPFDLSRLASDHAEARGKMRPGFTFGTAPTGRKGPRMRVKHLSRRAALMEFSGRGQRLPRGQRKRKIVAPSRRPAFVDVATFAAALLSRVFSLGGLAEFLKTPHRKLDTEEHGQTLTADYLDYAVQDVQVTWECFVELQRRYAEHGLGQTLVHRILSEASIGKAYLREMGIRPWRTVQSDFPPELLGYIMGTYYGGRAEVRLRRLLARVLYCDFTSMYPTVSTLMGLWEFVTAKGLTWRDATAETRRFLDRVTLADLQRRDTWRRFHVIVQLAPDADIFPARAKYDYATIPDDRRNPRQFTIGLNYLTSDQPVWYTLADCIASKLLSGRVPKFLKAIEFKAREQQDNLSPVTITGNPEFRVDPKKEDFFKRVIELRMRSTEPARTALKLVANSTGYGIFVEMNVSERSAPVAIHCYPSTGPQFLVDMDKVEEPGEFFHPLLGTLITSAARLMLAIAERLICDASLTWAFCDTDSMAIAKPTEMTEPDFLRKADTVRRWFQPLNPYAANIELFKIEDANYRVMDGKRTNELVRLYCFAVSSKRYVLFNIDGHGQPVIRKATAHGLGHLLPPYLDDAAPSDLPGPIIPLADIGVRRWQHDLWHCIARAALAENPDRPEFSKLPNFDQPAVSQYAVTTTLIARWFDTLNSKRPYAARVRPFNFMLMYQLHPRADWEGWRSEHGINDTNTAPSCVIAPYEKDRRKAASQCFDRDTGISVPTTMLKSYLNALAQYHLRPEAKFLNADYLDQGPTRRRHVKAASVVHIGKEANRWEEQSYIGIDPEAEITYGSGLEARQAELAYLQSAVRRHGPTLLARQVGISRQHIAEIAAGKATPGGTLLFRLCEGARKLQLSDDVDRDEARTVISLIKKNGIRKSAALAGLNAGHLARIINGKRRPTANVLKKLRAVRDAADP